MSVRSRQSALAFVLVIGLAVFLWGCGGSTSATTSSTVASTTRTTPTTAGSAADALLNTTVATTRETPQEYKDAAGQARPIAVLFYVPGGVDDTKVLDTFRVLQPDFTDFTFLAYDYKKPSAYGDLSILLQVNYPPEIVLIDKAGVVQRIWNGYVDEGTLAQSLINLRR